MLEEGSSVQATVYTSTPHSLIGSLGCLPLRLPDLINGSLCKPSPSRTEGPDTAEAATISDSVETRFQFSRRNV